jgi:hypothetical protein
VTRVRRSPTGHLVGHTYLDELVDLAYTVEAIVTLWEYAPDGAVRVRWANGNTTVRSRPRGSDPEVIGPRVAA